MAEQARLETPRAPDELSMARGSEVGLLAHRPVFTGDVLELADERLVAVVQHPCAIRHGHELAKRLLVCELRERKNPPPNDWSWGDYRRMFLPEMDGTSYAVEFDDVDVLPREVVEDVPRRAILAQVGVNLLMQRWVHHNTRVVVPTITIDDVTAGPFEEADLLGDACSDLVEAGIGPHDAVRRVDEWFGERSGRVGPARDAQQLAGAQCREEGAAATGRGVARADPGP